MLEQFSWAVKGCWTGRYPTGLRAPWVGEVFRGEFCQTFQGYCVLSVRRKSVCVELVPTPLQVL